MTFSQTHQMGIPGNPEQQAQGGAGGSAHSARSTFIPSTHQQAIFDFVNLGDGSAVVKAVAGSGKTTTILHCLRFIDPSDTVQMFAFNSSIAKELRSKIDAMETAAVESGQGRQDYTKVRASTFHSVGLGAVAKHLGIPARNVNTDGSKMRKLAKASMTPALYETYGDFCCKLVGLAKGQGIGAIVPNTEDRWYEIIQHHDLYLEAEEASEKEAVELATYLLELSNAESAKGNIDFDDQLYLPLLWKLRLWQNDWVFIDEAQDTNPVRRALAKLALKPGGRLIAVGDPRQAIYGFTGASHDAIDLIEHEFNTTELPLTVSYRCAKNIVSKAQKIVSYIQPHDAADEGKVSQMSLKDALAALTADDAVLCRQTAPLIELAFSLIAKGRGCVVLGRDIGQGLINLIEKQKAKGIDRLIEKLENFRDREVSKFMARGEEQKADQVVDRIACIMTVIDNLGETERTIPGLKDKISGIFSDNGTGLLTLSTVHKAKGREWETVGILEPNLMPSKWARQDWQVLQERNLQYVAWTRAKKHLIEIN